MSREKRQRPLSERIGRRQRMAKWLRIVFLGGGLVVAAVTLGSALFWPPINDVTTGETPQYPELEPRIYDANQRTVYRTVLDVIDEDPKFALVEGFPERYRIEATKKSIFFTDEMTIRLLPHGAHQTIVHVRSRSRVGKGDFGANARHIRRLFTLLDARLEPAE